MSRVQSLLMSTARQAAKNVAVDPDARFYINAVRNADGGRYMEVGVQRAIDTFIIGCKSDGIWPAIKASCILAGARTLAGALVPLVGNAPTNNNFVSGDYNRKTGLKGNASTKHLNANFSGTAVLMNNNHQSVYVSVLPDTSSAKSYIGQGNANDSEGSGNWHLTNGGSSSAVLTSRNKIGGSVFNTVSGGHLHTGFIGHRRNLNTGTDAVIVRSNGKDNGFTTGSTAEDSRSNLVFARGWPGAPSLPTDARLAFYSFGNALTLSLLDSRVTALYNAIGAAIVPQVSNADAQDWLNRVYDNGGTVSSTTASAVHTFCNAIDAAGIRDRFYRLNLFCGTGLSACLVPLYRGQSLGGTQFGNTTDTNVGPFVSGDFGETGATGGLKGNGTSKYLRPGITPSILPSPNSDSHVACYFAASSLTNNAHQVGLYDFSGTGDMVGVSTTATTTRAALGGGNVFATATPTALPAMVIGSRTSGAAVTQYLNGIAGTANTASVSSSASTAEIAVFARNTPGGGGYQLFSPDYIRAYSYGLSMTAAQAGAYNTAMQAFQAALGRNV